MLDIFYWYPLSIILVEFKGEMMLYADDTTVSFASAEISALFQVVTEDLKLISEWLKHNWLLLNLS